MAITKSDADLDDAWFEAVTDSEEEAMARKHEENSARGTKRAMKRIRPVIIDE